MISNLTAGDYFHVKRHIEFTLITLLSPVLLMFLVPGCVPIPYFHSVPTETTYINYSENNFNNIILGQFSNTVEARKFTKDVSKLDKDIEVVDFSDLFKDLFPDHKPIIGIPVSKLLEPETRNRIREKGVRFIVVLSSYQSTENTVTDSGVIYLASHYSEIETSSLSAGLVDLDMPSSITYLEANAKAKDSATMLTIFVFFNTPMTFDSTFAGMASQVVNEIRQKIPDESVKITVASGEW